MALTTVPEPPDGPPTLEHGSEGGVVHTPGGRGARRRGRPEDAREAGQRMLRSRSGHARQRRGRGKIPDGGRDQPCPAAPGPHPDSPAAGAESGWRQRRRQTRGSAIPRCPGWGETVAAHFLSNPARRPTSLATGVNFNNFIGTRVADRGSLRGSRGPARVVPINHLTHVRRVRRDLTPPSGISCLGFHICKMDRTALVVPFYTFDLSQNIFTSVN